MQNGSVNWSYQPIMHNLKVATVIELQAWLEFLRVVYDQESFARFAVIATGWNHQCSAVICTHLVIFIICHFCGTICCEYASDGDMLISQNSPELKKSDKRGGL